MSSDAQFGSPALRIPEEPRRRGSNDASFSDDRFSDPVEHAPLTPEQLEAYEKMQQAKREEARDKTFDTLLAKEAEVVMDAVGMAELKKSLVERCGAEVAEASSGGGPKFLLVFHGDEYVSTKAAARVRTVETRTHFTVVVPQKDGTKKTMVFVKLK
jgi:hypothetical protein